MYIERKKEKKKATNITQLNMR